MSNHREEAQQVPTRGTPSQSQHPQSFQDATPAGVGDIQGGGEKEQGLLGEAIGMMVHEKGSVII